MNAIDRATELFEMPGKRVPQLAREYAQHLCFKFAGCSEVILTAYCHYAQYVEKLSCDDPMYKIDNEGLNWFNSHKE